MPPNSTFVDVNLTTKLLRFLNMQNPGQTVYDFDDFREYEMDEEDIRKACDKWHAEDSGCAFDEIAHDFTHEYHHEEETA